MTTDIVENFPGFPEGINGQQLMMNMKEQARKHGARLLMEDVASVDCDEKPFSVMSANGEQYTAHALIISTGATARRLSLDSEKKLWGKGISACAVCDGGLPVFRNKELAVIGGGDSAVEEAMHLTNFGSRVYLIHRRDKLRASKIMQQRAMNHPKITILWNRIVEEFLGEERLEGLRLKDVTTDETMMLPVAGAFEAIGHRPNTSFLQGKCLVDEDGYIVTEADSTETSVPGIFAAGDVQDKKFRQAITAAGSGCMAALEAERWLQEKGLI